MSQLPADCLNEIFEYLENDKNILYSCLLVNRLWCEIAVRILWKDTWRFKHSINISYQEKVLSQILGTLIACLPNKSRDLLYKNGIITTTSTWKPPLFNYASFCKVLIIHEIDKMIQHFLEKQPVISHNVKYKKYLLSQEILKMFMNEISSLKSLDYNSGGYLGYAKTIQEGVTFTFFPRTNNCLKDLTELKCSSDIHFEFFYQLSQICHNIQSLSIEFSDFTSSGIADLISLQHDLKSASLKYGDSGTVEKEIISSLTKFSSTLTKLQIEDSYMPLSFISIFTNLEELNLLFELSSGFDDFNQLQYAIFPKLKVLKFSNEYPKVEFLINFLEINGKNLKELYLDIDYINSLNLTIAKFCPNLKILSTVFINETETLKIILNGCQYLESIKILCGNYLNDKELLKVLVNYSPKNFFELKLYYIYNKSEIIPEDLESFFINWKEKNQVPFSLIIVKNHDSEVGLELNVGNMKIIERYVKMGFIKYGKERVNLFSI